MTDRKVIPLDKDAVKTWGEHLDDARAARKTVKQWWDANLKKYAPSPTDDPDGYGTQLNTNRDFTLVERKKADLFYQRPDVSVIPSPLFAGQEHLLDAHAQILNEKLGLDGVNAKKLVHKVLFDVLCPSGTGWTIMGYESTTVDTETVDPMTGQPMTVPVPVYEDCFWKGFSPTQGLVPADCKDTEWDDAPWLGYEFDLATRVAKRKRWVPKDFVGSSPREELHFDHGMKPRAGDSVVHCTLIYYKSAIFRDDVVHPLHYTLLIFVEGIEQPVEHKDSPYQTLDAQGRLTPDSLLGNPIHPLTIRTLTDSAYVPSNCTISRPTVNEMNTFRQQMVQFRDAAILRWMYNVDALPPDALAKIVRSPIGGFIGVPSEAFTGEGGIKELPHGSYPRENFAINDYLDNDLGRTWAIDENQQGVKGEASGTASEAQLVQANANAVSGVELGAVLDWYVKGVTKYSTLVQRYLSVEKAATIVGQQAAMEWDSWRKMIPASLAFEALPDSSKRTDVAWERKRAMDEYTFFANDPHINRMELLKQLLPRLNYGSKVLNPQPPEKQADVTKPGVSLKGDDFNPLNPQFAICIEIARQCGLQISDGAIAEAQAGAVNQAMMQQVVAEATPDGATTDDAHGGKVAQMESLSKHANEQSGGLQGSGAPAPMGAGGMVQ